MSVAPVHPWKDQPQAEPRERAQRAPKRCSYCGARGHDRRFHGDAEVAPGSVDDIRALAPTTIHGRIRSKTIAMTKASKAERRSLALVEYPDDVARPVTRGDCASMPRPCPFVSCSHHLYLDVHPESGTLKLNFPHLEVQEMAETCSLDVADRGGITLEELGTVLNLTRERIRQVEVRALAKVKAESEDLSTDNATASIGDLGARIGGGLP